MLDVIRKSDVITALVTECLSAVEAEEGEAREVAINLLTALISDVNETPVLDVAPVRHGKWVLIGTDKRGRGGIWECRGRDGCGKSYPYKCNYCPNCGAKMDDGQEEDNDA